MGALWSAPAKRRGSRAGRPKSLTSQFLDAARVASREVCAANLIITMATTRSQQTLRPRSAWCGMPSPRVFRGLALALALALTPTASVLVAAAPVSGLTDASPLVTRAGAPDASLCEDGESGHRKATTAGDAHLKLDELDEAEACYLGALRYKSDFPMALYGLGEVHARARRDGLAIEAYRLATACWPQYVDAHVALGDVLARQNKRKRADAAVYAAVEACLLYTSPSPRDATLSRMPSSA